LADFWCYHIVSINVSTWSVVHAGHVEVVKDLEFLKPCKLNAHTAGCYCIAMDPVDRYFLFSIKGSLFISHPLVLLWIPWICNLYYFNWVIWSAI